MKWWEVRGPGWIKGHEAVLRGDLLLSGPDSE